MMVSERLNVLESLVWGYSRPEKLLNLLADIPVNWIELKVHLLSASQTTRSLAQRKADLEHVAR